MSGQTVIQNIYSGGVDGVWLRSQPVSKFKIGGTALTAYGNNFDTWLDSSGNARDATEASGNSTNNSLAANRDTNYYAAFGFAQYNTTAGGGSNTTGFYIGVSVDGRATSGGATQYYSTIFSDVNTTNTGFDLKYSGDVGGYIFSAGTGSTRVSVTVQCQTLFTYEDRHVVEAWWDGTNINLRVDFNDATVATATCGTISAGTLACHFWPSYVGDTYEVVLFKNYFPSSANRNRIASWLGQQQLLSLHPSGDAAATESGSDTFTSSGTTISNSMRATESGSDTFASTGVTLVRSGSMAATESGTDTFAAVSSVTVAVTGFGRVSEYGIKDAFAASSAATPRSGSMAATEGAVDTFASTGNVLPNRTGTMAAVESGSDTFVASSHTIVTGTLAAVESGTDTFSASTQSAIDLAFVQWLQTESRIPCILVEVIARVGGVETTRYLSNSGYTSGPSDTPANQYYTAVVNGGCVITEQMPIDGNASMAFGDIELVNKDGLLDAWLNDVWVGRACRVYVGDQRWTRANFRLVFDGITADLGSSSYDTLNLKMRDKLQRLNNAVTDVKLGGTTNNADRLLPLTFGEVSNVEPLLIDKATLKYQYHNGAANGLIEVRDFGMPVSVTDTPASGFFTLNASPAGTITCSAQGDNSGGYSNTVSKLVQRVVTGFGTDPFTSGDLDANSLANFDAQNPQPVGIYLPDRTNVLEVCQALAASVGAQLVMPATGLLRLVKLTLPNTSTPTAVSQSMMFERTLEVADRVAVQAAVKLNYCKNWTVQGDLQTGILPEHKDLFSQEWLTVTASDATTASIYKQTKEPDPQDTFLLVSADATNEANRRLALWKVQRHLIRYEGRADLLTEQLGGYQTITYPRFGLSGGATGQIVSIERDWINGRVKFEVLV